jgi:hypothetical protein
MNERIKELAERAGAIEAKFITNIPRALSLNGEEIQEFAELIVQECIDVVEKLSPFYNDYRDKIEDGFRNDAIFEIKNRFGIEN